MPELARSLVDWLAPQSGERILDLGCGDGVLSRVIAEHGAQVVGFDRSPAFVGAMRENGFEAVQGDGQTLDYDGKFDAVFSNAALHWMRDDPQAVIDGVARALRPGGRFVAEFGAHGNVAPVHDALIAEAQARGRDPSVLDPWFFPKPENYIKQLESAGFAIRREQCFERPTPLPGDMADWLFTLAGPFVQAFDAGVERDAYVAAVRARLEPDLCNARGEWTVPYVRLRFDAHKPV
ncbi:methyltransferase domain-containing protein [Salinisphaera dokdonensis]|uniref:methyltransferase domain-containing protein n=1 Tax=Salinisphaera dokdonensis TaxID=454598 RepID=UPI003340B861